jgi:hypothetical protein
MFPNPNAKETEDDEQYRKEGSPLCEQVMTKGITY